MGVSWAAVLFRREVLDRIAQGDVTLAFRRWFRQPPKNGSTLRTAIGVISLRDVQAVAPDAIDEHDARRAGFASRAELLASLPQEGTLFRIELELVGADPRVALRETRIESSDAACKLETRLARLDGRAAKPWTRQLLELVAAHPAVVSTRLAKLANMERMELKRRMRQLKELGLTESLGVGYRLSPRGQDLLRLRRR
jgi:hypothetical protein